MSMQPKAIRVLLAALAALLLSIALPAQELETPQAPDTRRGDVVDSVHGVDIADPYRWLEDQWSPETRAWIEAQNEYTASLLGDLPWREALAARFAEMMRIDHVGVPTVRGDRYFLTKRAADQDLPIIYMREGLDGEDQVLIDPHTMSADHSVSVGMREVSRDGSLLIYGVREGGEDEVTLRILDVETRTDLPDRMPKGRYGSISLLPDNSGFYFSRREPEGVRIFFHAIGSDPADNPMIFGEGVTPEKFVGCDLSDDGRWLLLDISIGWARDQLYLKDLASDGPVVTLVDDVDAPFYGEIVGGTLFLETSWEAPNGRVLAIDPADPARENWREIIAEREDSVIRSMEFAGGRLFISYMRNVQSEVVSFDREGNRLSEISVDTIGSVSNIIGEWDCNEAFFTFSSFHIPTTIYRYDVESGEREVWHRLEAPIESDRFEVRQAWYESADGTRVPMFLVHRRDIELDGDNPTFLTGYGGFNASLRPYFSPAAAVWVESGGIYAVANMRGGGEFGEDWHHAGWRENKQNVFDDFIAAAEWLIANGYTNPDRLAIRGGSNGGLLVSACLTQRPELYRAVVCTYPLLDMVRYHMFLVGSTWVSEYGSADDPEQFRYIHAYSPYHNVERGTEYPAVLFITGDGDTRVDPLHARKMTALLQWATGSERPVMLRYDTRAGHSGGLPVTRQIEEAALSYSFLFWQLGVDPER